MPSETNPEADSPAAVSNSGRMRWDVVQIEVIDDLALQVHFADGLSGQVRFLPSHLTGVFAPLREPAFFALAFVDHGAVAWPGDIDLAPDAMYQAIQSQGEWVLT